MPGDPDHPPRSDDLHPTSPRPLRRRWWFRLLLLAAVLYVAWCTTLYFCQGWLLFPADMAPQPSPRRYDATTVELELPIEPAGRVIAWFMPATGSNPDVPAPLVIFFHGNAEIIDYQHTVVEGYRRLGCAVLLPEYRGYGRSDGKPGERAIVADAVRFYDKIITRPDVDADRIVIHGRSLGGGPAAQLAVKRPGHPLILESTFSSAAAMAHKYAAPAFLVRHPFRTDRALAAAGTAPVLIFHGTRDDIIPVSHGRRLRDIAPHATYVEYDCRHNDFPGSDNEQAYWNEIARFLERTGIIEGTPP